MKIACSVTVHQGDPKKHQIIVYYCLSNSLQCDFYNAKEEEGPCQYSFTKPKHLVMCSNKEVHKITLKRALKTISQKIGEENETHSNHSKQ